MTVPSLASDPRRWTKFHAFDNTVVVVESGSDGPGQRLSPRPMADGRSQADLSLHALRFQPLLRIGTGNVVICMNRIDPPPLMPGVLERHDPVVDPLPVVFDSPHSGRHYPHDFAYAVDFHKLRSAEDMYVDELFSTAPAAGATLLRALFPRSYIDLNRGPADIDESILAEPWPEPVRPSDKTRNGKGLIRSQAKGEPLYDRKLMVADLQNRLENYYHPYHRTLEEIIARHRSDFGAVWHINCHSWTPPQTGRDGKPVKSVDFFLGDRDGSTSEPEFTRMVAEYLQKLGYVVLVNRLFKGMELVRRHGCPGKGQHSLQLEINRDNYMDKYGYYKLERFAEFQSHLDGLVRGISEYVRARI